MDLSEQIKELRSQLAAINNTRTGDISTLPDNKDKGTFQYLKSRIASQPYHYCICLPIAVIVLLYMARPECVTRELRDGKGNNRYVVCHKKLFTYALVFSAVVILAIFYYTGTM
jgi:hypothetical protein